MMRQSVSGNHFNPIMKKPLHTKKQLKRRERYAGMQKVKTGAKLCWESRENKHGYSLGLCLNKRTVWLTNVRLASVAEVKRVLKASILFVHTADSKDAKKV